MTKTVDIKACKYWEDKFIRWFYNGELADTQSARIMGERLQQSIDYLAPAVEEYRAAGLADDETCAAVINDYESAKEILTVGLSHKYTA